MICDNAIIAAIYVALTFASYPISFLGIQIRFAEALVLICFFRRDFAIGLTIGCLISNAFSPIIGWDMLFGTLATLLSVVAISFMKQLFIASLIPVIINGFVVGAELYFVLEQPFWINVGTVALGEFIAVSVVGYILFMIIGRNKQFLQLILADHNIDFKW
jgi:uncharacterized membrane protein